MSHDICIRKLIRMQRLVIILLIIVSLFIPLSSHPEKETNLPDYGQCFVQESCSRTILTLNSWGLPIDKKNQNERFEKIASILRDSSYGIVCLQETFHTNLRHKIMTNAYNKYNIYSRYDRDRDLAFGLVKMDCYGGLMTLSKYPIIEEKFFQYPLLSKYSFIEKMAKKGLLITVVDVDGQFINIVNTHMYSGSNKNAIAMRKSQIEFIKEKLNSNDIGDNPTIIAGDFNINHPNIEGKEINKDCSNFEALSEFTDIEENWINTQYTYDRLTNQMAYETSRQVLDFIVRIDNTDAVDKSLKLYNQDVVFNNKQEVSDHNGVVSQFTIATDDSHSENLVMH